MSQFVYTSHAGRIDHGGFYPGSFMGFVMVAEVGTKHVRQIEVAYEDTYGRAKRAAEGAAARWRAQHAAGEVLPHFAAPRR